jgi:hypothetical protein
VGDCGYFAKECGTQPVGIASQWELDLYHKRQMEGSFHKIYFPEN